MAPDSEAAADVGLSADHGIARCYRFSYAFHQFLRGLWTLSERREVIRCESNAAG
jgi:hypothetical protein